MQEEQERNNYEEKELMEKSSTWSRNGQKEKKNANISHLPSNSHHLKPWGLISSSVSVLRVTQMTAKLTTWEFQSPPTPKPHSMLNASA